MPPPALRTTIAIALALVTIIQLWQQHAHVEQRHRHQFSRDRPRPTPAAPSSKDAAPAATLELVCAGSGDRGRSLYCQAGGEARCGADATVPLHLRAWERSDGTLTIDGGDGERKRLAVRDDGRVVCVDSGEDRWKFLRRGGHRAGLVHETRGRVRVFDDLDFEGQQGVLIARTRHKPRAPFQPKKLDAAHVARSRAEALVAACVEINQCVGCTNSSLSFLGDDVAVLARSGRRRVDGVARAVKL
jgi:hypothetical protein